MGFGRGLGYLQRGATQNTTDTVKKGGELLPMVRRTVQFSVGVEEAWWESFLQCSAGVWLPAMATTATTATPGDDEVTFAHRSAAAGFDGQSDYVMPAMEVHHQKKKHEKRSN